MEKEFTTVLRFGSDRTLISPSAASPSTGYVGITAAVAVEIPNSNPKES